MFFINVDETFLLFLAILFFDVAGVCKYMGKLETADGTAAFFKRVFFKYFCVVGWKEMITSNEGIT